jgi:glycerol-3-phosphate responsive antiterminator
MKDRSSGPHLPRILLATSGRDPLQLPPIDDVGVLFRDTDLPALLAAAMATRVPEAVDLDSIRGLRTDDDAVAFVMERLGIRVVMTRRPQTAEFVAEAGGLALLHTLAFDSTGVARILESLPVSTGIGAVISPGLVLPHMLPSEVSRLPRPLLAYGLIMEPADALACLALADGLVLGVAEAAAMAPLLEDSSQPLRNHPTNP